MSIESGPGGTLITGDHIQLYRLKVLQKALEMEVRSDGRMRLTRGRTAYALIKEEFGLKGNREKVLKQFAEHVEKWQPSTATPNPKEQ